MTNLLHLTYLQLRIFVYFNKKITKELIISTHATKTLQEITSATLYSTSPSTSTSPSSSTSSSSTLSSSQTCKCPLCGGKGEIIADEKEMARDSQKCKYCNGNRMIFVFGDDKMPTTCSYCYGSGIADPFMDCPDQSHSQS